MQSQREVLSNAHEECSDAPITVCTCIGINPYTGIHRNTHTNSKGSAMSRSGPLKVCICGGGGHAHALVALAASNNDVETRILILEEEEAERWDSLIARTPVTCVIHESDGRTREVKSKPRLVTSNVKEALNGCDMVIFTPPAQNHERYLQAIEPHVGKNLIIVGLPGKLGFEYLCYQLLGAKSDLCTILSFEDSPSDCKLIEFGQKVEIFYTLEYLVGSIVRGKGICRRPPLMSLQMLHGSRPLFRPAKHFIEVLLTPTIFVRPVVMYGMWKDWDGKALKDAPFFYQTISKETVELLDNCSKENLALVSSLSEKVELDLSGIKDLYQWYLERYTSDISDRKDLESILKSNKAFGDVRHEMVEADDGLTPDFSCLVEDLAMGLAVLRGIAQIAGVSVPDTDKVIQWCQTKTGTEYLIDGELKGKDIQSSRCPQRFGLKTLEDIVAGKNNQQ